MDADSRHKEIGKDIDHYISQRKGGGLFGWFSKKEGSSGQDAAQPEAQASTVLPQDASAPAQDAQEYAEQAPVDAEPKKGLWGRLFGSQEQASVVTAVESEVPVVDEDMRQVARCALRFIKMADTDAQSKIKTSEEFAQFKEILQRRQIIK